LAFWAGSTSPKPAWFLQVQSQMQRDFEIKLVLIFHSKKKRGKIERNISDLDVKKSDQVPDLNQIEKSLGRLWIVFNRNMLLRP
jgi:hypothetical protein